MTLFGSGLGRNVIPALFVLVLVAGVPVFSLHSVRQDRIARLPRPAIYFSAVLSQWLLAALGLATLLSNPLGFREMAFRLLSLAGFAYWTGLVTALTLAALGFFIFLESRGWWPKTSERVYLLLPETRREKLCAVLAVAPTAALCEEFLYRGYLLAQLTLWLGSDSWGVGVSSAAFGLAHAYQGTGGAIRAALLGSMLACAVTRSGSIYPSIAAHYLVDVVAFLWLGPRLRRLGR